MSISQSCHGEKSQCVIEQLVPKTTPLTVLYTNIFISVDGHGSHPQLWQYNHIYIITMRFFLGKIAGL